MDNVTHSLAGLLLAESAARLRTHRTGTEPSAPWRTVAAVSSAIAANLPDSDLLYTGFGAERLTYLLYHRGYTHTVVAVLVGAVGLWAAAWAFYRWRQRGAVARADSSWLLALLVVSTMSHLVLDWTNSYGVHPFWPMDNRWRYGDAVFIVEPWLWVVSVPTLVAASPRRWAQALLGLVLLAGLVLAWRVDLVSTGAAIVLTGGAGLSIALARTLRREARTVTAVAAWVVVTLVMAGGSAIARATARRAASEAARAVDPTAAVLDVVVSPLPANPMCTSVITVEQAGETYRVTTARVSAAPSVTEASRCGSRDTADGLFTPSRRRSTPAVQWDGEWSAPVAELVALARESCPALAALRFIRVPAWRPLGESDVMLGDVRYGGASGSGFSDVRVPRRSSTCPAAVPPWSPPRRDILGA